MSDVCGDLIKRMLLIVALCGAIGILLNGSFYIERLFIAACENLRNPYGIEVVTSG